MLKGSCLPHELTRFILPWWLFQSRPPQYLQSSELTSIPSTKSLLTWRMPDSTIGWGTRTQWHWAQSPHNSHTSVYPVIITTMATMARGSIMDTGSGGLRQSDILHQISRERKRKWQKVSTPEFLDRNSAPASSCYTWCRFSIPLSVVWILVTERSFANPCSRTNHMAKLQSLANTLAP